MVVGEISDEIDSISFRIRSDITDRGDKFLKIKDFGYWQGKRILEERFKRLLCKGQCL